MLFCSVWYVFILFIRFYNICLHSCKSYNIFLLSPFNALFSLSSSDILLLSFLTFSSCYYGNSLFCLLFCSYRVLMIDYMFVIVYLKIVISSSYFLILFINCSILCLFSSFNALFSFLSSAISLLYSSAISSLLEGGTVS